MDMPVERILEISKISQEPVSLETPIGEEEDSHLGDFIQDEHIPIPSEEAAHALLREQLCEVMDTLSEREQKVLPGDQGAHPPDRGQGTAQAPTSDEKPEAAGLPGYVKIP